MGAHKWAVPLPATTRDTQPADTANARGKMGLMHLQT